MAKVLINESTLSNLGDIVRAAKGIEKYPSSTFIIRNSNVDDEGNWIGGNLQPSRIDTTFILPFENIHVSIKALEQYDNSRSIYIYLPDGTTRTLSSITTKGYQYGYNWSQCPITEFDIDLSGYMGQSIRIIFTGDSNQNENNGTWIKLESKTLIENTYLPSEISNELTSEFNKRVVVPNSALTLGGSDSTNSSIFAYNKWQWFLRWAKDHQKTISFQTNGQYIFDHSSKFTDELDTIIVTLNSGMANTMCSECTSLIKIPTFIFPNNYSSYNMQSWFSNCQHLIEIPDNKIIIQGTVSNGMRSLTDCFFQCYKLRRFTKNIYPLWKKDNNMYSMTFYNCYVLDEVEDLPVLEKNSTSNLFNNTFSFCHRLKKLTFETNNNSPITVEWKSQTIILTNIGYGYQPASMSSGSGCEQALVTDTTTYEEFKNNSNYTTSLTEYSRYNHDSAVETINSLPDTSAYLATAGGTNTIKFWGSAGSATDGGAINTLTAAEIAVATAKGWTVTLS